VPTADLLESAVTPEVGEIAGDRTSVDIERDGRTLEMTISADDPVALRAGQNTWLGFLEVGEQVVEVADGFGDRHGH
jgi:KEOPS complex subunit Pcc1